MQTNVMAAIMPATSPLTRGTQRAKLWINYRHLCKAAARLSEPNARQIKKTCIDRTKAGYIWQWNGSDVNVNSISEAERQRYGIPDNERLAALVAEYKSCEAEANTDAAAGDLGREIDRLYHAMSEAKLNYHQYYNIINERYNVSKENGKLFAQRWAVWQYIADNYNRAKNSLTIYHAAYGMVFPGHLSDINSFANFKKACDKDGIESKVVDQRAIAKAAKRITSFQYAMLQSLYIQPQKITAAAAHRKLIAACEGLSEKPYCLASVKNYFKEFENNADLYAARYGAAAAQKQLPHLSLLPANDRNTQWQIDGWTMPFWGAEFQRYVLHLVRDNYSRKIVGWSVGESENAGLILAGLEDAMYKTGVFPGELLSDKHGFHKTAKRIKTETQRMGTVWTTTTNAQRNQLAERYNQYLDELCKDFAGYTGKNVTAKGKDARPAPEAMLEFAKTANFKTADEVRAIAAYVVTEFNRTPLELLEGMSPNEKYDLSEDKKCFKLTENDRIQLLRPAVAYKVIRGQITIKVGMKKHEFQLPAELINRYNNREVLVVHEDLAQGIYISDIKTGEELGCIGPKVKVAGAVPDQTEEDRKRINQMTGRTKGVTVPARKAAQQRIAEALKDNPEAIALINHHSLPKDIRALAEKDMELKRALADAGINANNLPVRTVKAATIEMPVAAAQKTKDAPFKKGSGDMERVSLDALLNID